MPIFKSKDKQGNRSVNFSFIDGIPEIPRDTPVNVTLNKLNRTLEIRLRMSKDSPFTLSLNKITNVLQTNEKEIYEKGKSVAGRAVVGGVLLGPLGAIVGSISGIGNKKKVQNRNFLVINYESYGEQKVLSFEMVGASIGVAALISELRTEVGLPSKEL